MEVVGGEDADTELHRAAVVVGGRLATRRRRGGVVDDVVGQQQVARTWPQAVTIRHLAAGHVDAVVHHAVKAQTALSILLLLLQFLLHVRPRLAVNLAQRQSVAEFGIDGGPCPSAEDYPEPDSTCFMRPSSLGGGRILRRTLSVRPSVRLSVRLSVRPVIVAIGNVFSSTASVTDVLFGTH